MKEVVDEVVHLLRAAGLISGVDSPQTVTYFPHRDADLAARFSVQCGVWSDSAAEVCRDTLIREVEVDGNYVNVKLDCRRFADKILTSVETLGFQYGFDRRLAGKRVFIEHTSLNPVYPINVATFRSSAIGNAMTHLYERFGADVETHFWVEDKARQISMVVRGLRRLGIAPSDLVSMVKKGDHAIGAIFAATLYEFLNSELSSDTAILDRMFPLSGFSPNFHGNSESYDPKDSDVSNETEVAKLCELCIRGFEETFAATDVRMDHYDFESAHLNNVYASLIQEVVLDTKHAPNTDTETQHGRPRISLNYLRRNAIYYATMLDACSQIVSVVSIRQADLASVSARLAEDVHNNSGKVVTIVPFGDVHVTGGQNDSIKAGIFNTVDALLLTHSKELHRHSNEVAEALKFALLRCEAGKTCELSGSAFQVHREFLQLLRTMESLKQMSYQGNYVNEIHKEDGNREMALLKQIAVFPSVVERVVKSTEFHVLARYVINLAKETRKYLHRCIREKVAGDLSKRVLAAVELVLSNALHVMGVKAQESERSRDLADSEVR